MLNINELKSHELFPGFSGKFIHGEKLTVSFWEIKKGSPLPLHNHSNEQITMLNEGQLELIIEGKSCILNPGDIIVIPPNAMHQGNALVDCKVMDIFCPVREDYKL